MRNFTMNMVMAAASVVMASGLVAFADPANADVPASLTVQTADLNLAAPAGRVTAERRIRAAADQICGTDGTIMSVSGRCRAEAVGQADAALQAQIVAR